MMISLGKTFLQPFLVGLEKLKKKTYQLAIARQFSCKCTEINRLMIEKVLLKPSDVFMNVANV